jgi:hypothetical protein
MRALRRLKSKKKIWLCCCTHSDHVAAGRRLRDTPPIEKNVIEKLLPHIPKQTHYMNREERRGGKYFEKWRLIVPLSIVNRLWEEPNVENI